MESSEVCSHCSAVKAPFECGICKKALCKNCQQAVDTHAFSFLTKIPAELKLGNACPNCFEEKVLPHKIIYDETMERAKDIYFLTNNYPGYVHVLQKHNKRVIIEKCVDRREMIMRMAFFAAELGFNAIIAADINNSKIRMGKYQSSTWSGSAIPANINGEQLERSSLKRI